MNPYYITEQCNDLNELITELYEAFFDDDGSELLDDDYIEAGMTLQRLIAKCESILDDIKKD